MNMPVRSDDLRKAVVDSLAAPSADIARHVLAMAGASPDQIEKSITTSTGLVAYDLQVPAKNLAYAGRFGNGDAASGDGWRYRGRGPLMRTFRAGYAEAAADIGLDLVGDPDLLETPEAGARDAGAFWTRRRINPIADADDLAAVTRAVNGGLIDLGLRREALARARAIWSD